MKHLTPEIRRVLAQLAVLERKLFTAVRADQQRARHNTENTTHDEEI